MFRASSAHLQEDTVVYMQHMVLPLSTRVRYKHYIFTVKTKKTFINITLKGNKYLIDIFSVVL